MPCPVRFQSSGAVVACGRIGCVEGCGFFGPDGVPCLRVIGVLSGPCEDASTAGAALVTEGLEGWAA